jgi:hypothetical protein
MLFAATRLVFFLAGRFLLVVLARLAVVDMRRVDFRAFVDLDFLRARDFVRFLAMA